MAKLKLDNGFEMEVQLKIGYMCYTPIIIVSLWKDGKGYLIPEGKNVYLEPTDYDNYRILDCEYDSDDQFLPILGEYVAEIKKDCKQHEGYFCCSPEENIRITFSNGRKTDIVTICLEYYAWAGVEFKKLGAIDGSFEFQTDKDRIISFYKELEQEYDDEKKPVRLYASSAGSEEKLYQSEKEIINSQERIETDKPIILIGSDIFPKDFSLREKEKNDFYSFYNELRKEYCVATIDDYGIMVAKKTFGLRLSEKLDNLLMLGYRGYPKNKEIIFLRCQNSVLEMHCCLNRYITCIEFDDWCKGDWNIALSEIKKYIEHPLPVTYLTDYIWSRVGLFCDV